ncbi:unnamed protein product [Candidula unifasciata]|uniref:Uncharacterized protein n=1 Tax=Candidula unifasciata TaxID=100452 RepID=A0A8S3Z045_9EUPU|nr:unnamed protein product [Candidula unifasciata]
MAKASSSAEPLDELSCQFLICPLCFEQFVSPKVLPCQHTFCLACLKSYVDSRGLDHTIPCPMCKEIVIVPGNDVSNFKNNFWIVSLLHFVEDSKTVKGQTKLSVFETPSTFDTQALTSQTLCGACNEQSILVSFCEPCTLWLCTICTKAHGRLPATASHSLRSSEEVDAQCKAIVVVGEKAIGELQQANIEREEYLLAHICQLPEDTGLLKKRIESAAEEAYKVIKEKAKSLQQKIEQFHRDQNEELSKKLAVVDDRKKELSHLQELLEKVKLCNDGFQNQNAIKMVERFLVSSSLQDFSSHGDNTVNLTFDAFGNNLTELKNLDMGQLCVVSEKIQKSQYLHDRPLGVHKIASLVEREYITALAINKFADKFVVTSNQNVLVFKPHSRIPKAFLSPLAERSINKPWGIAYCEDERCIYVTEAGRHEGDGAVLAYTYDGSFLSVIASGLTLPRGIALHKGYIFVCDQIDRCVYIFNTRGKVIRVLKKTPDGKYLFNGPMFISVGKNNEIAVSDSCTSVKIFDKECCLKFTYTSNIAGSQFWDVHVLQNGTVIVCDWKHGVHKISPDFSSNGLISIESNLLREPSALAGLENGNSVYIATCGGEIFSVI